MLEYLYRPSLWSMLGHQNLSIHPNTKQGIYLLENDSITALLQNEIKFEIGIFILSLDLFRSVNDHVFITQSHVFSQSFFDHSPPKSWILLIAFMRCSMNNIAVQMVSLPDPRLYDYKKMMNSKNKYDDATEVFHKKLFPSCLTYPRNDCSLLRRLARQ